MSISIIINDIFNGRNILVLSKGTNFGIKAFERGNHKFTLDEQNYILLDENNNKWQITDEALTFNDEKLSRLPANEAFWFGWIIFYPDTSVYDN